MPSPAYSAFFAANSRPAPAQLVARIASDTLSDSSKVYNLELYYEVESANRLVFHCVDANAARELADALQRHTVDGLRVIDAA